MTTGASAGYTGPAGEWEIRYMIQVHHLPPVGGQGHTQLFEVPGVGSLELIAGEDDHFVLWERGASRDDFTVRTFSDPGSVVSRISVSANDLTVDGEVEAWNHAPALIANGDRRHAVRIDGSRVEVRPIPDKPRWADQEQGVVMTACPDGRTVVVTTPRHGGELIAYDVVDQRRRALLDLGGGGLKILRFRDEGRDLWIANHDQIHRIDTRTWSVTDATRLRNDRSGSFIETMAFDRGGGRCAVSYAVRHVMALADVPEGWYAGPVGGQVLIFDTETFHVTHGLDDPGWIGDVGLLSDGRVIGVTSPTFLSEPRPLHHPLYPARDPHAQDWF